MAGADTRVRSGNLWAVVERFEWTGGPEPARCQAIDRPSLMQYDAPVALADEIRAWLDERTASTECMVRGFRSDPGT
jgi:hypothetical protein